MKDSFDKNISETNNKLKSLFVELSSGNKSRKKLINKKIIEEFIPTQNKTQDYLNYAECNVKGELTGKWKCSILKLIFFTYSFCLFLYQVDMW